MNQKGQVRELLTTMWEDWKDRYDNTDADNFSYWKTELRKLWGQRDGDDEYYNDDMEAWWWYCSSCSLAGRRSLQRDRAATLIAQVGSIKIVGSEMGHFHEQWWGDCWDCYIKQKYWGWLTIPQGLNCLIKIFDFDVFDDEGHGHQKWPTNSEWLTQKLLKRYKQNTKVIQ